MYCEWCIALNLKSEPEGGVAQGQSTIPYTPK